MDAPKCRICGSAHWARQGHKWKDVEVPVVKRPHPEVVAELRAEISELERPVDRIAALERCERALAEVGAALAELRALWVGGVVEVEGSGFDRGAYQREYMRKRRAKKGGEDVNE